MVNNTANAVKNTVKRGSMLDKLLGSRLRARLITWMLLHREERYFARQLALLLDEDSKNVGSELARLASMGILTIRQEGRQKYYGVDRSCPFLKELRGIVIKTSGLVHFLQKTLKPLAGRLRVVFVYGSFAKGEETAHSDVDLLILGEVEIKEISGLLGPIARKIQRELNPVVYTPAEFQKKVEEGHHFVNHLLNEKKIFVIGGKNELEEFIS